jgi:hypothetical protein
MIARPARLSTFLCAAMVLLPSVCLAQTDKPLMRTFPEFVGTWVLDEAASTGQLRITPRIPLRMTIETTPETIVVTKRPRLGPTDRSSATPPPEVYRLDGTETRLVDGNVRLDISHRFTLVADMLALTVKESRTGWNNGHTAVTDAYSVSGDVLTLHRQLTSVTAAGEIRVMQHPPNNFRHTYIYRRETRTAAR